ncbi:hypothetical protein SAY86_019446 [Trapa natans]|uniref:Uncharacterized protein n=1 Tax=Trapa natans TaxID=22666 RepID=A0AAN7LJY2_TRANT|nr:hypothetical protein SAY86_019446 [Trapa natans]
MAVEGGDGIGPISSMLFSSSDPKESEDILSHEDISWVDSCITEDPEILESGWGSLKQALLETLEYSAAEIYNNQIEKNEVDVIMAASVEESEITKSETADDNLVNFVFTDKEDKGNANSPIDGNLGSQSSVGRPILSDYQEFLDRAELQESVNMSSEFNFGTTDDKVMGDRAFKAWKYETRGEEDIDLTDQFLIDKTDMGSEKSPIDGSLGAQSYTRNALSPNYKYKEFLDGGGLQESGSMSSSFNLETMDTEPLGEDIFQVDKLSASDSDLINHPLKDKAYKKSEKSLGDESLGAQISVISPFLPNYREFPDERTEEISSEFKLEIIGNDNTGEGIFKVWELETAEEEDEFSKDLNKAIAASAGSFQESSPLQPNDLSGLELRDQKVGHIYGLIAGISDLSLD